jgi:hypothetical protein
MKIDRPGAAIIGAVLMVAFRIVGAQEALASGRFRDARSAVRDDAHRRQPAASPAFSAGSLIGPSSGCTPNICCRPSSSPAECCLPFWLTTSYVW